MLFVFRHNSFIICNDNIFFNFSDLISNTVNFNSYNSAKQKLFGVLKNS